MAVEVIKWPKEDFKINVLWSFANNGLVCFALKPHGVKKVWVNDFRRKSLYSSMTILNSPEDFFKIQVLSESLCAPGPQWLIADSEHSFIHPSCIHLSFTNPLSLSVMHALVHDADALLLVCFSTTQAGSQRDPKASQIDVTVMVRLWLWWVTIVRSQVYLNMLMYMGYKWLISHFWTHISHSSPSMMPIFCSHPLWSPPFHCPDPISA